ncbi:hypothetical protein [Aliiroseovarius lamellibrachiae]|uniref:hypothetical protein n=1 Tax=Aliiroseovarius lamellibrachiae TaxID=1924933 RepID=UPI001BDFD4C1|nr:hypothetical protein [Aliiroseovarius lamellibrachiae]MBT2129578.1 hypothetical protein [Aliiroseovarius lamellibrachiae]
MIWVVSLFNIAIFGWTTFEALTTMGIIGPAPPVLPFTPTFTVQILFLLWLVGNLILWLVARRLRAA